MILRAARFLCVLYAEICINATAANIKDRTDVDCRFTDGPSLLVALARVMSEALEAKTFESRFARAESPD